MMLKIQAHREQAIPSLRAVRPDVPEWLDGVLQKMLAKRPEDRQRTMSEVMGELQQHALPQTGPALSVGEGPASVAETLNLRQGQVDTSSDKADAGLSLASREGQISPLSLWERGRGCGLRGDFDLSLRFDGKGSCGATCSAPPNQKRVLLVVSFLRRFTKRQKIAAAVATGMIAAVVIDPSNT